MRRVCCRRRRLAGRRRRVTHCAGLVGAEAGVCWKVYAIVGSINPFSKGTASICRAFSHRVRQKGVDGKRRLSGEIFMRSHRWCGMVQPCYEEYDAPGIVPKPKTHQQVPEARPRNPRPQSSPRESESRAKAAVLAWLSQRTCQFSSWIPVWPLEIRRHAAAI